MNLPPNYAIIVISQQTGDKPMKRKGTKELLHSGLKGSKLTQQQLQVVAYNLFNGQKLAVMLRMQQITSRVFSGSRLRFAADSALKTLQLLR